MTARLVGLVFAAAIAVGCRAQAPDTTTADSTPESAKTAPAAAPAATPGWFDVLGEAAGLTFTHVNGASGHYYFPEMLSPGVGLFDYDNDGDLDVYLVQGDRLGAGEPGSAPAPAPPVGAPPNGRLYRNELHVGPDGNRSVRFVDVTDQSGIDARGYGMGMAAGDYDNNGCVDLFLTFLDKSQLYKNNCDGTFTDVSHASGTAGDGWSVSAAFLDYDRDGWLDLYVGRYVDYTLANDVTCTGLTGRRDYCTPAVYTSQPDRLYHNARNGTFVDVTAKALLGGTFGPALGVSTADFNNDGWVDIYVANDTKPNLLWINQRDGTFRESGLLNGAALTAEGKAEASMGVDAGDFDNDGDDDLFMTELPAQGSNLFVNDGKGMFDDLSSRTGVTALTLGYSGFGAGWLDVDNDGWLDLLQVNGSIQEIEGQDRSFRYAERKLLLRNTGEGRFVDVTREAGAAFGALEVSRGMALGDVDNDGDTDVMVNNLNGQPRLFVNQLGNRHHWVCLRLTGDRATRDMLGARVEVTRKDGRSVFRRSRADGSYASANDPRVLIGLGPSSEPPDVRVTWPDGRSERWSTVAVDQCTTLRQGSGRRES
jgi:hypothetical protein